MKITLLGTGSSAGVPYVGCSCAVCRSENSKNNRLRVSAYIEINDAKLLIDSSPDLRQQALRYGIERVDAVLYTHAHADHTHGIDDLRAFNYLSKAELPIYGDEDTLQKIQQQFAHVFRPPPPDRSGIWPIACLLPNPFPQAPTTRFAVRNQPVVAILQGHGKSHSIGYRIGNFAYSTDCDQLSDEALGALQGLDAWVVDCLRYQPAPTHAHLERTLQWIEKLRPKRAILTHMSHDLDYDTLLSELPPGVEPGYDGMTIETPDETLG